jgi:hypothetical protein
MKTFTQIVVAISMTGASIAHAADCPPPPSSIEPTVSVQVTHDKKSQMYKYRYTIHNGASAQLSLNWFGLLINQAPVSFLSPAHWDGRFTSANYMPYRFGWDTSDVDPAIANKVTSDGTLAGSFYALKPGSSLGGFEITSTQPPGVVQFFAWGDAQPPTSAPTEKDDEAMPNCAGWDFTNAQLLTQVTGVTTGPLDPNTISVRLRAREEKGHGPHLGINSKAPSGKMAILILSTRMFDASQVDVSTVMFGPAYSTPVSSQIVGGGTGEQIGRDEREGWEKWHEQFHPDDIDRKKSHPQNLLLVFDVASLDVQCHLDQALFLRGQTKSGQRITGAVPAKMVGCKAGELGKHKSHKIPHRWWPEKKRSRSHRPR